MADFWQDMPRSENVEDMRPRGVLPYRTLWADPAHVRPLTALEQIMQRFPDQSNTPMARGLGILDVDDAAARAQLAGMMANAASNPGSLTVPLPRPRPRSRPFGARMDVADEGMTPYSDAMPANANPGTYHGGDAPSLLHWEPDPLSGPVRLTSQLAPGGLPWEQYRRSENVERPGPWQSIKDEALRSYRWWTQHGYDRGPLPPWSLSGWRPSQLGLDAGIADLEQMGRR